MTERGFYIIKDSFFNDINEPYLKGNKQGNRPHYYCFKDNNSELYWMIPLSSKVESEHEINEINRKARKVLGMLKRGVKFTPTQPDILRIQNILLNK